MDTVISEEHHPSLYYDDGNVVLMTFSLSGERRLFRVHRSILCKHSPVFADMFAIPPLMSDEPSHGISESYDGALLVQMPESPENLESLINVLYDPL